MTKRSAQAWITHYDDGGRTTRPSQRRSATLCTGQDPQIFTIDLHDDRTTRFTAIVITRAEIERVLKANPKPKRGRP